MEKYNCSECGKWHREWPAYGFDSPDYYFGLTEEEKENSDLSNDFCVVRKAEVTYYFIRAVLYQPVKNHCDTVDYGIWTSLSEANFIDYKVNFKSPLHEARYFGWLANQLPGYDEASIKLQVVTGRKGERPSVFPDPKQDHPLAHDFYKGISLTEAERRMVAFTH